MSNLSISLSFSDDGEYLQLSRMDAAILLTWIMGGDHDNEPEAKTEEQKTPEAPKAPKQNSPAPASNSGRPPLTRPKDEPSQRTGPLKLPIQAPKSSENSAPSAAPISSRVAPPEAKKESAAKIVKEAVEVPDLPFSITPQSAEFVKAPVPSPTENELLEEEPYWDYGTPPEPKQIG